MDLLPLIIQLISGAAGGGLAGQVSKALNGGPMLNAILGALGGVGSGSILGALGGADAGLDLVSILSMVIGSGAGGAVLAGVGGILKNILSK